MTREEIRNTGIADKESYTFEDFRRIVRMLRDPDGGCPWDKVQTHESLKKDFRNEVDEAFEGIEILDKTGDGSNLCEELGDVMLHIIMQAVIAEEEGLFTAEDVVRGIAQKMIRRHPHVFGDAEADSPEEVLMTWDEVKKREKAMRAPKK